MVEFMGAIAWGIAGGLAFSVVFHVGAYLLKKNRKNNKNCS